MAAASLPGNLTARQPHCLAPVLPSLPPSLGSAFSDRLWRPSLPRVFPSCSGSAEAVLLESCVQPLPRALSPRCLSSFPRCHFTFGEASLPPFPQETLSRSLGCSPFYVLPSRCLLSVIGLFACVQSAQLQIVGRTWPVSQLQSATVSAQPES